MEGLYRAIVNTTNEMQQKNRIKVTRVPKKNIAEEEKSSWKYLGKNVGRKEEKMPQAKKDFFLRKRI